MAVHSAFQELKDDEKCFHRNGTEIFLSGFPFPYCPVIITFHPIRKMEFL